MKLKSLLALAGAGLASSILCGAPASATEVTRQVTVSNIAAVGTVRPGGPSTQSLVRVYVNPAAWGSTNCRADAGDLSPDDWYLLPTLMMAWRDGKTISLAVESTLKIDTTDTVCRIVVVGVS